ncbi:hypothetical protein VC83_06195 [Pseudogymnoascus destructans]|uniref:Tryptophan synthase beta chain-like PALP domain-containing protein n=1 Tax=Pseudogymnoascus destructans TaxID=655981 RepID=A0A177ACD4_9PEZI|nr:uncharacterized protein VC83_06195 [Pseudogymnoascus destructans]OAF58843.1 hypothetical protein VC83_06195 [Pseudogymnoascus destructans]
MADPTSLPLTRASVLSAHTLITPFIHRTPVLTSTYLSQLASTPRAAAELEGTPWAGQTPANPKIRFWFKCENFQKVGAFKARGAFHALLRLVESEGWEEGGGRERGVVTHSSGEFFFFFVQSLEDIKQLLIQLPNRQPRPSRLPRLRNPQNPLPHRHAPHQHPRQNRRHPILRRPRPLQRLHRPRARSRRRRSNHRDRRYTYPSLRPSACDAWTGDRGVGVTRAGFGGAEGDWEERGAECDYRALWGGGLLSGTALSAEGTGIVVFGAEPEFEGADDCKRGLAAGKRIEAVKSLTVADGLRTPVGAWPWKVISDKKLVRGVYSVTEEQIKATLRLVLERMKVVVEPSSVVGLAVALWNEDFRSVVEAEQGREEWDLGVVFTGGNVNLEGLGKLFEAK